ncbi:MAG: glycosyltransferase family 9 protein [Candidatus Omnitrophota bacterium]|nr:glycosyltransferase family 9 protein [Candidatus Omnitrophota bacterium]
MRSLDRWLGIPVCFLLSAAGRFLSLFARQAAPKPAAQNILFIKLSELGNIALAVPLLRKVKNENPTAGLFFLTFARNKPLFSLLGIIPDGHIITIRDTSLGVFFADSTKAIVRMLRFRIGVVFDLEFFSRVSAIISYLSGAPKRIGFYGFAMEGLYRGNLLTHKVLYNPALHMAKMYYALFQAMEGKHKFGPGLKEAITNEDVCLPRYLSSAREAGLIKEKLKSLGLPEGSKLILINPGDGAISLREWPLENFISLAQKLLEDKTNYLAVVGIKGEGAKADALCKAVRNQRCLNLAGQTSLSEIITLCSMAALLITNDGGLAHLASLTDVWKVVFFGPESPQIYAPLGENTRVAYSHFPCSPCLSAFNHRNSLCRDNRCLKVISPEEAYKLIGPILA